MRNHVPASIPARWDWRKLVAILSVGAGALGLGCSDDAEGEPPVDGIAGGWSNEAANLFACISPDGRMWLGDSPTELEGPNPCTVDDTTSEFHCSPPGDESAFDGTLDASGDQLTLDILPCPTDPAECRVTYARDSSLTCD